MGLVDSVLQEYFKVPLVSVWSLINLAFPNTGLQELRNTNSFVSSNSYIYSHNNVYESPNNLENNSNDLGITQ